MITSEMYFWPMYFPESSHGLGMHIGWFIFSDPPEGSPLRAKLVARSGYFELYRCQRGFLFELLSLLVGDFSANEINT